MAWRDWFGDPYKLENDLLKAQLEQSVVFGQAIEATLDAITQLNTRLTTVENILRQHRLAK